MSSTRAALASLALTALVSLSPACKDAPPGEAAKVVAPEATPTPPAAQGGPSEATLEAGAAKQANSGKGANRWKDTGVYLDGVPIAYLSFGELPITLKPTFVPVKVDAERRPGTKDPTWKWSKERYYKWTDYLRALGVEPRKVRELHVYGPKASEAVIATGKELASKQAEGYMFRFGAIISGKAIPHVPDGFGNGRTPDKISAVMIYVDKKPPTLVRNVGFELDGEVVQGIPYFGMPERGGVRVYLDDRVVTTLRRNEFDPATGTPGADGRPTFGLYETLKAKGVDTSKIVEGWTVHRELREAKLAADQLTSIRFAFEEHERGVALGDKPLVANVIALHTREIKPEELPQILPEEEP